MKSSKDFILSYIQKEYTIDPAKDPMALNYAESGYIDSMGMVKFIVDIEDEFGIAFEDEELSSPDFKVVGRLIALVDSKINNGTPVERQ